MADRDERTVLTTGINSGLGLATAVEMARRGYHSVGTVRSKAKAKTVAEAADLAGVDIETHILDVTDAKGCAALIADVQPDVLVNNAGYMLYSAVEEVDDRAAGQLLDTMVLAPMRLARLCIPHMRENGWGRIIQVSSLSARVSFPLMGWYQGAKQALEGVSDAMRIELAGSGIGVVLIEPGVFRSELSSEFSAPHAEDSFYATAYSRSGSFFNQLERFQTEAEDVAKVIAGAARARSPRARYPVGVDAQLSVLSDPWTPTVIRDRAIRTFFGL